MKNYWKSIDELKPVKQTKKTEPDKMDSVFNLFDNKTEYANTNRRDFLKLFGFTLGSASLLAACKEPVRKAIPYLIKPEEVTPGKANYYASTFFDGDEYNSILVKVRDGRPIKVEGNDLSPISKGSTSARVQGSVLSLYDNHRFTSPKIGKKDAPWEEVDQKIIEQLEILKNENKKVVLLSSTIISPSTKKVIADFIEKYPNVEHVVYDTFSLSALREANKKSFGQESIPTFHIDKANIVVSFYADFLGTWLSPVTFTKQYASKRDPANKNMLQHIQLESGMSLTGSNADFRYQIKPEEELLILSNLYNEVAKETGGTTYTVANSSVDVADIAKKLVSNKGKSLVVSSTNNVHIQLVVNAINSALQNIGKTIDFNIPLNLKQGNDVKLTNTLKRITSSGIDGIILYNANPVYDLPKGEEIGKAISNMELSISLSCSPNETSPYVQYVCPDNHYLESWNDAEPVKNTFSLAQPAIRTIFKTRQAQNSFLKWSGKEPDFHAYIQKYWEQNLAPSNTIDFRGFWNKTLQNGIFEKKALNSNPPVSYSSASLAQAINNATPATNTVKVVLYESIAIGSGRSANIPWLQETPDPVTKTVWDNFAAVSPKYAEENNLETGDVIRINSIEIPVVVQPGQAYNTISIAVGYGRKNAGIVATGVGVNIFELEGFSRNGGYYITDATVSKTDKTQLIASTQSHHSMEGRALIRETTLEEYMHDPVSGNEMHEEIEKKHVTMYPKPEFPGHHWGMAVNLSTCTGCMACSVSCQAENNVPVVGKKEVSRAHDMHWIRIDRYYNGDLENPEVVRQPVMCQHCDNAPCENVCPVAATNHSHEGINQMAYNRCIGTRYCNNNCPYKVRRFNWLDYTQADAIPNNHYDPAGMTLDLPRMVLNPDVTVRAKGVIEKCSFCIQRIQEKKLTAKLENRQLADGDIKTACAQACPADAIVFGDLSDENSKVSKLFKDPRNYHILEEIHTLPSVGYLTKIRNKG